MNKKYNQDAIKHIYFKLARIMNQKTWNIRIRMDGYNLNATECNFHPFPCKYLIKKMVRCPRKTKPEYTIKIAL